MAIIKNTKTGFEHNVNDKLLIEIMTGHRKDYHEVVDASDEVLEQIKEKNKEQDPHQKIMGKLKFKDDSEKISLLEQAKELGIRGANLMSIEKLKEKITEKTKL